MAAEVVARLQPALGLSAPASRQDVISALLNEYGNSFGGDDELSYNWSSGPAFKELPPPPPGSSEKPSPMSMRFQLRGTCYHFLCYSPSSRIQVPADRTA